ncbi:MAG: hypothetical protein NTW60_02040 [Candidatus Wolfebacteria bacterium]|nr:hypothetical protein [Candidatus Wolfebacteria bacterium]
MAKFLGIIIWGVLVYSILNFLPVSYSSGTSFLASGKDTLLDSVKDSKNASRAISVFKRDGKFLGGSLNYPGGVDIYGIKNSPKNQNLFFAATDKGLFVSRDGGLNWRNFSDIEKKIGENTKIYGLIFSPDGRAYISVYGDNKGFLYASNDNFFSLDKIADWDKEGVYSMSLAGDDLYLGLSDGRLLKYSLSGKDIGEVNKLKSPVIKLEVFRGNIYLVLKSGGFWISNDSGKNFKSGGNNFKDFYADPRNPNLIYAITGYGLIR